MKEKVKRRPLRLRLIWILMVLLGYWLYRNISTSVFLHDKDKINIMFYSRVPRLYSLDRRGLDYYISFPAEAEILVPGGYGYYRVGAINKLATLEKKPDIIRKSFSRALSSMVDIYFYPAAASIFYKESDNPGFNPSLSEVFLNPGNANLIDRFFIFASMIGKSKNSYKEIDLGGDFSHENFIKKNMGIFYNRTYRNSQFNVQVKYDKSYKTAQMISDILDGEGIRVVDLSGGESNIKSHCKIITTKDKLNSSAVLGMKTFFGCRVVPGNVSVSDIILELGTLEKDWSAN